MAIIKPGPLVQAISGNAGNVNFRSVAGRTIVANRKSVHRSPNAAQQLGPDFLRRCRALWNAATVPEQLAWNMVARSKPVKDRFGQARYLTGLQTWTRYLTPWWLANNQVFSWTVLPNPYPEAYIPDPLTSITAAFDSGANTYEITPVPLDTQVQYMLVWAIRFGKGTQVPSRMWRFVGSAFTTGAAVDVASIFQSAQLNWTLCPGESVWLAVQTLFTAAGSIGGQIVYLKTTVT